MSEAAEDGVWFVYDGACPLCSLAAQALRIRENCGPLHLVDARTSNNVSLLEIIRQRRLDLDEGMVILYQNRFYHGKDALRFMAEYGAPAGVFNRLNYAFFRSEGTARFFYPWLRGIRNLLLRVRGVSPIRNLADDGDPIFKSIFGADWDRLPRVMRRHYANRAYNDDVTVVEGHLKIESSPVGRLLKPFFWLAKTLVPYEGENIPCTVQFTTDVRSNAFRFDRTFHFSGRKPYHFRSAMLPVRGSEIVERMSLGLCWRMNYAWNGEKVILSHRGYALRVLGFLIPLPLTVLIGKGYAEEIPLSDDEFAMMTEIRHVLWGKIYGYSGSFRIAKDR